jgi:hypothetical protein
MKILSNLPLSQISFMSFSALDSKPSTAGMK